MMGRLAAWVVSLALTISGLVALAIVYFFGLTGLPLLAAPLLIATGISAGGIANGLQNPIWVLVIFVVVIGGFIVLHFVNPYGLGGVI
jgi:hypothetical protein